VQRFIRGRLILASVLILYGLACAISPQTWRFLDGVNLLIHEAGHVLWGFDGYYLRVLGGTLTQILMPLAFVVYFALKRQRFAAFAVLFWVAQSLFNVYVYANDAVIESLPLVGGEGTIHDWHYLLNEIGWLRYTRAVAGTIYVVGLLTLITSAAGMIYNSLHSANDEPLVPRR
jgi:hypothetical protein